MYFCRPFRWLWGLIPLALIGILVIYSTNDQIERDLQSRAQSALSDNQLSWAVPSFDGRDGIISGTSGRPDEQQQALNIVGTLWGVRIVEDRATLLPSKKPYVWSANRKRERIRFKGYVPSENDRKTILGIARANFPGFKLDDRMKLASGAPPRETWLGGVSFALKYLGNLKGGFVRLENEQIEIKGEAVDVRGYNSIRAAVTENLPSGIVLKGQFVWLPKADPFVWKVEYDGNSVVLSGHAPSDVTQRKLASRARRAFRGAAIVDRMILASGARKRWAEAAMAALDQLSLLENGSAELDGKVLTFAGLAANKDMAKKIENSIRSGLPPVFQVKGKISVAEQVKPTLPKIDPYRWSVSRGNGVLTLKGFIPNVRIRSAVINFAKELIADHRIVDEMKFAEGEPEDADWIDRIRFGLVLLSRLNFGDVDLVNGDLSIKGEAASVTTYQEVMNDLAVPVGNGLLFKTIEIIPARVSPYTLTATLEDKTLSLMGYVPDHDARKAVLKAIAGYSNVSLDNGLTLASGAPDLWRAAVLNGLNLLTKLRQGKLSMKDGSVVIDGTAPSNAVAEDIRNGLENGFVGGYQKTSVIRVVEKQPASPSIELPKSGVLPANPLLAPAKDAGKTVNSSEMREAHRAVPAVPDVAKGFRTEPDSSTHSPESAGPAKEATLTKDEDVISARPETDLSGAMKLGSDAVAKAAEPPVALKGEAPQEASAAKSGDGSKADISGASMSGGDAVAKAVEALVEPDKATNEELASNGDDKPKGSDPSDQKSSGKIVAKMAEPSAEQDKAGGEDLYSKTDGDKKIAVKTGSDSLPKPAEPSATSKEDKLVTQTVIRKSVLKADECQQVFNSELLSGIIMFEKRSSKLRTGVEPLLLRLANIANRCQRARIEIAGHTDSDGSHEFNKSLSLKRAETVVRFLVDAGIAPDRLSARGYGEDRPKVPNTTLSNKAKNRRIEFVVRG